jgi:hypothetical protein
LRIQHCHRGIGPPCARNSNGHTWLPDRYFEGGGQPRAPFRQFFARTSAPLLYQNSRIGANGYNITLKPGAYEMKLHFMEPI